MVSGVMFKLDSEKTSASVLWPDGRQPSRQTISDTATAMFQDDHLVTCNLSGELVCRLPESKAKHIPSSGDAGVFERAARDRSAGLRPGALRKPTGFGPDHRSALLRDPGAEEAGTGRACIGF